MNKKLSLNSVSCELGFGGLPNTQALNQIIHLSKERGLPIYFDAEIYGVESVHGSQPLLNDDGTVTKVLVGISPHYFDENQPKRLTNPSESRDGSIVFSRFTCLDMEYISVDETGMYQEGMALSHERFYCLEDELTNYLKPGQLKKKSKPQRQKEALIALVLELSVEELRPLGREGVWDMLKKRAPSLFTTGESSMNQFFNANIDLIAFERGRRGKK